MMKWLQSFAAMTTLVVTGLIVGSQSQFHSSSFNQRQGEGAAEIHSGLVAQHNPLENLPESAARSRKTLGVHLNRLPSSLRSHIGLQDGVGLLVEHVVPDSSADEAGILVHDVLCKLDNQILVNKEQLAALVHMQEDNSQITLQLYRNGEKLNKEVTLKPGKTPVKRIHAPFDAFEYFHGEGGRSEFQNCAVCHVGSGALEEYSEDIIDNYRFFHGSEGRAEFQVCSNCHQRSVTPLSFNSPY